MPQEVYNGSMKKKVAIVAFLLVFAVGPISLLFSGAPEEQFNAPALSGLRAGELYGIMGALPGDYEQIASLGATATGFSGPVASAELASALEGAASHGLGLGARAVAAKRIQGPGLSIDLAKLEAETAKAFSQVQDSEGLAYYYAIDEPCHTDKQGRLDKWNLSVSDLKQAYRAMKGAAPSVPIMVNFGDLKCLAEYMEKSCRDWKVADIAAFTLTPKKLRQGGGYLEQQDEIARRVKECDPSLSVVPLVAAYEHATRNQPMPSAEWIESAAENIKKRAHLDGMMFFPWHRNANYMARAIGDVIGLPEYQQAFRKAFAGN